MRKRKLINHIALFFLISLLFTSTESMSVFAVPSDGSTQTLQMKDTYNGYLKTHEGAARPQEEVNVPLKEYSQATAATEVLSGFEGASGEFLQTSEEGYVEWDINVNTAGLYNIYVEYYPIKGRNSTIEREIQINGQLPFSGAGHILFSRVWVDANAIKRDNRGNDIRPRQIEEPSWQGVYCSDNMGYVTEPYLFYFNSGKNTIRLTSVKEPLLIKSIKLVNEQSINPYKEVAKTYDEKGYSIAQQQQIIIQGEHAATKSDPTLYPAYDRSSPATQPYNVSKIRLNTIGGYRWQDPGQWITWKVNIKKAGLYRIAIKFRQNIVRGNFSNRKLTIDGRVPFKEMENITFKYDGAWQMCQLGGDKPYLFYLDEGTHDLKMEVVLGGLADILQEAENDLYILNSAYRKIIMVTGQSPDSGQTLDVLRDYQLDTVIPGVIATLKEQSRRMADMSSRLEAYTGQKGSNNAILDALAYQLKDMANRPRTIVGRLNALKDNIGALGAWILTTREQPLEIDYIDVSSPDIPLPKADVGFFRKMVHEFQAFFLSFTEDYNSLGDVSNKKDAVKVWIGTGRDQAQVLKEMIDDTFTPETGIPVNLQLIQSGSLLPATVAHIGPDVAMQIGSGEPVNYATRGAVVDLTKFPDFKDVAGRFYDSAMVPYKFEGGVYALPEQQMFPMLFYRKDIMDELNLKVPQTWDDVMEILPEIQKSNMDFAIPVSDVGQPWNSMVSYTMFLYQGGGEVYKDRGIASALDSEAAIEAFKKWTDLFISYKLPKQLNFVNRFRTGEVPLAISDYSLYNTLQVFAPELRGLWDFAPIPGTRKEDGTIDRSCPSSGVAVAMMKSAKNKDDAWQFMKWWTDKDTQVRYAREMESLMGASARYPTANIQALQELPWPVKDYKALMEQWKWVKGIPEVPGGYFTPRHLDNAFRKTIYDSVDARETLLDYVQIINEEIDNKRKEFGLDIRNGGK